MVIIKNLILIAIVYFIYRKIKSAILDDPKQDLEEKFGNSSGAGDDDIMIKDPQCGVYFPQRDGRSLKNGSEILYFCSDKCRDEYKNEN